MTAQVDKFIITMLYTRLYFEFKDIDEIPENGIYLDSDGMVNYISRRGEIRIVELEEMDQEAIRVRVIDKSSKEAIKTFTMKHIKYPCKKCKIHTEHGEVGTRLFCTECGTYALRKDE